jgi:hypothetical protein
MLALPNGRSAEWRIDAPDPAELEGEVEAAELAALSVKFAQYQTLGPKWQAFLDRRRAGDTVWRFATEDGRRNGFAVVRGGRPVSRFVVFGRV